MMLFQSLSFRLALTYVGLFCASVAVLMGVYYWVSVIQPNEKVKAEVNREAKALSRIYLVEGQDRLVAALEARSARKAPRMAFHALIDPNGQVITTNLPSWPRKSAARWIEIEADIYRDGDEADHNALVRDHLFEDGARLMVGRDSEDIDDREEMVATAAIWIICGTIVLGFMGGSLMSLAIRARIDAVNLAARTVMEGDLSGRVPVRGTGDDFDKLGETLNLMLGRIEELFEAVRRVSDNVAHELRTPLSRLMARLDELRQGGLDADYSRALADAALQEAQRLHRIFDALLRIARIESGSNLAGMREIDVSTLAADAVEFHSPEAQARGIALDARITPGLRTVAEPDLLFQALSNLLDNALKYTPEGGRITVGAEGMGRTVTLSVGDNGPGISAAEKARVTERFYRSAHTAAFPGEGLGLSLVAAVARQHRGQLRFRDNAPGLIADLVIPRMRAE